MMKLKPLLMVAGCFFILPIVGHATERFIETRTGLVYYVSQDADGNILIQTDNPETGASWVKTITPQNPHYHDYVDRFRLPDYESPDYYYDNYTGPYAPYLGPSGVLPMFYDGFYHHGDLDHH